MYLGKWGTVCNQKFNAKSAQVACKQMGYDDGVMVGNINENGVCQAYDNKDFCGDQD